MEGGLLRRIGRVRSMILRLFLACFCSVVRIGGSERAKRAVNALLLAGYAADQRVVKALNYPRKMQNMEGG
jgi:hypothetical protein